MTLTDALKRWAEVEPGRCGFGESGPRGADRWYVQFRPSRIERHILGRYDTGEMESDDYALVLAVVIESIEARGWDWEIHGYAGSGRASGTYTYTGEVCCSTGSHIAEDDPPALALLIAYLDAVEAEATS